ncbi:MAG: amidohydrolase family protein [Vicinamibacterales bacterium]
MDFRRFSHGLVAVLFVAVLGVVRLLAQQGAPQQSADYDLLIVNGRIMDGTGNPWFYADVAIRQERIAAIGKLAGKARAARVVDARGKAVAPGFIDIHTHTYDDVISEKVWAGEEEKRFFAPNYVSQGVTTVVSNQCGYGPTSLRTQRSILASRGTGPNVILVIGHNSVRREVMQNDFRRPATPAEIDRMRAVVRQAIADGAMGMSSGLEYVPAIWSTPDEIVALVKELVPSRGVYMAHERSSGLTPMWYVASQDPPGPPTMIDNVRELIEVGERTGATVVAAHIKARGADFWGASTVLIRMINEARARGVDIWADCYPYTTSGSDGGATLIPSWASGRRGEQVDFKAILADPQKRQALEKDIRAAINWRGGPDNVVVMDYPNKDWIGKSLGELARMNGISDVEMAIKLRLEGFPDRAGGARLRGFSMAEADIEAFYRQPWVATSSDGSIALPSDGPSAHARFYGTFPRKIRRYAMERGVVSVEDAIRSMTSLPAQIMGLRDRGVLREGTAADVVVFDPARIRDTATFFEPHQYADGIEYVLVNGKFAVDRGQLTWQRSGKVLQR